MYRHIRQQFCQLFLLLFAFFASILTSPQLFIFNDNQPASLEKRVGIDSSRYFLYIRITLKNSYFPVFQRGVAKNSPRYSSGYFIFLIAFFAEHCDYTSYLCAGT